MDGIGPTLSFLSVFLLIVDSAANDTDIGSGMCDDDDIRLVDGASDREGRVELCKDGLWGTMCDDNWDIYDAIVICRQLGFSPTGTYNAL